jgi:hypothetical protein
MDAVRLHEVSMYRYTVAAVARAVAPSSFRSSGDAASPAL